VFFLLSFESSLKSLGVKSGELGDVLPIRNQPRQKQPLQHSERCVVLVKKHTSSQFASPFFFNCISQFRYYRRIINFCYSGSLLDIICQDFFFCIKLRTSKLFLQKEEPYLITFYFELLFLDHSHEPLHEPMFHRLLHIYP
jgi:hypothetical protein